VIGFGGKVDEVILFKEKKKGKKGKKKDKEKREKKRNAK
jgi:hypothetical protein